MGDELRRKMIESYIGAYNRFDVAAMLANADPEIIFRNISKGEVNLRTDGIDEMRKQAEESGASFVGREQVITCITISEHQAVVDVQFSGTLAVDLPNGMKAGDRIALKGKTIFEFRGDKIVGITDIS